MLYMASIGEVYGSNFQTDSALEKAKHGSRIFASNIVHKHFSTRHEAPEMWKGNNMKPEAITALVRQVCMNNPQFRAVHVSKVSDKVNMFPYLINGAVEYFVIVELTEKQTQMYSIYITPTHMEAF